MSRGDYNNRAGVGNYMHANSNEVTILDKGFQSGTYILSLDMEKQTSIKKTSIPLPLFVAAPFIGCGRFVFSLL